MNNRHKIAVSLFLPLVALMAMGAVVISIRSGKGAEADNPPSESSPPPAGVSNRFGMYSPGNLDEVPVEAKSKMMAVLGVSSYGAFQDAVIATVRDLGVEWVRVDFWWDGMRFVEQADYLERLRSAGFEVVGSTRLTDRFLPSDLVKFETGLRHLVLRYPWIKTWQVGNEPNISLVYPDDYPRLFLTGARVVRENCPGCKVMLAGVAARSPSEAQAQEVYQRALAEIATACGESRPFDIFDMHFYGSAGSEDELLSSILGYRRLLSQNGFDAGIEIWLTESATYTGKLAEPPGAPLQTEDQQAVELVRRFVAGLSAGLARVSWARPYENYGYGGLAEDGIFDNAGLVYNGLGQEAARGIKAGTKKKSWFAYRTLIAKAQGYDEIIRRAPGVYEFSFGARRSPVFVVWDAGAASTPREPLPPEVQGSITITDMLGNEKQSTGDGLLPGPEPVFLEPD